jgi:hypothetical protein
MWLRSPSRSVAEFIRQPVDHQQAQATQRPLVERIGRAGKCLADLSGRVERRQCILVTQVECAAVVGDRHPDLAARMGFCMAVDHAVGQQLLDRGLGPQDNVLGSGACRLPDVAQHVRQGFHSRGEAV